MATCGWCKTRGLDKVRDSGDGKVLEQHYRPNTRTVCNGPGSTYIRKR